jgi:hypothetical protein
MALSVPTIENGHIDHHGSGESEESGQSFTVIIPDLFVSPMSTTPHINEHYRKVKMDSVNWVMELVYKPCFVMPVTYFVVTVFWAKMKSYDERLRI